MAISKDVGIRDYLHELTQFGEYKASQGWLTRRITWVVIVAVCAAAAYTTYNTQRVADYQGMWTFLNYLQLEYSAPAILLLGGIWAGYRVVNFPVFADFLIAVEAEMRRVTWPSWQEAKRASAVVIAVLLLLAATLFLIDSVWTALFNLLHIR